MKSGDVALAALPQADGQIKNRPVLLLKAMPPHGDWLVCGISTQLQHYVAGFDEVIKQSDPDFTDSGIKSASLIRLGFLAVLPMHQLIGRIGAINDARIQRMLRNLSQHLLR